MTAFRLDDSPGPGTHVFVVGVGKYPHLKDGTGLRTPKPMGMGQLSSPPVSAMKMLEWVDSTLYNPEAPLKSIEVLISDNKAATFTDSAGISAAIGEATFDNFEASALAWFNRLDTDVNNVGVFYFCGHGLGDGINTSLLMSDYGSAPVPNRHALNFPAFRMALGGCKAEKQVFFLDTCRVVNAAALLNPYDMGQPGLVGNVMRVFPGANPVIYAVRMGEQAFGLPGQVSYFTEALLEGLSRFGVFNRKGTTWAVQPQHLQMAMAALLDDFTGRPQCPADGISGTGFQLHVLKQAPEVILRVSLTKSAANPTAQIVCKFNGTDHARPNHDHPWRTFLGVGQCSVEARFPAGSPHSCTPVPLYLYPPHSDVELEVQ